MGKQDTQWFVEGSLGEAGLQPQRRSLFKDERGSQKAGCLLFVSNYASMASLTLFFFFAVTV